MAIICPTVTPSTDPHEFREMVERIAPFAKRMHLDFMDGVFAPTQSIGLAQAWWPEGAQVDLHLMYKEPAAHVETLIGLLPSMVIIHAEADGEFPWFAEALHAAGIKVGVALLPNTKPEVLKPSLKHIDHVMIFGGQLGYFGGAANIALLAKAQECRDMKPELEIGWDGGINVHNVHLFAAGGIDVLNVGSSIQKAPNPTQAFAELQAALTSQTEIAPPQIEPSPGM